MSGAPSRAIRDNHDTQQCVQCGDRMLAKSVSSSGVNHPTMARVRLYVTTLYECISCYNVCTITKDVM